MEPSNGSRILLHEAREDPPELNRLKIVEAFGRRKCPKLIEQIQDPDTVLRCNALRVLCDEFHNPLSVQGCISAGALPALHKHIKGADDDTRVWASKALSICSQDAYGRSAMLAEDTAATLLESLGDSVTEVRINLLSSLTHFSSAMEAVHHMVAANYPALLVSKAAEEDVEVKPYVLRLLRSLLRSKSGLQIVLESSGVETCHELLNEGNPEVKMEAAHSLGFMCFDGSAKETAIKCGSVQSLALILSDDDWRVCAQALYALMTIAIDDEGKKAFLEAGGVQQLIELLGHHEPMVRRHAIKLIASVAVHPQVRKQLLADASCLSRLGRMEKGHDAILAKHAAIAKDAVLWEP